MRPTRREREAHRAFTRYRASTDPEALTRMFDVTAPILLSLAGHLLGDRGRAEDAVQATFLDVIENADRFDPARPIIPWLTGVLLNHVRRERRQLARRIEPDRLAPALETDTPERLAEAREFAQIVTASLDRLPRIYRDVLRLRLVQGLDTKEIARRLRRPTETVKTQLTRGMERLRRDLPKGAAPTLALLLGGGATAGRAHAAVLGERGAAASTLHANRPWVWVAVAATGALLSAPWWWPGSGEGRGGEQRASGDANHSASAVATELDATTPTDPTLQSSRSALAIEGQLVARVQWHDGTPAAGVVVSARPASDATWLRELRATTDERGEVAFAADDWQGVESWTLRSSRGEPATPIDRTTGPRTLILPAGMTVSGRVTGIDREPVAGAVLWLTPPGELPDRGAAAATTDDTGNFALRDVPPGSTVGALANGLAASSLATVEDSRATELELRCLTRAPLIRGSVHGPDGAPIEGAAVLVGLVSLQDSPMIGTPYRTRTARDGSFVCHNQRPGILNRIWVRTPGFALHRSTARLGAGEEHVAEVRLLAGAAIAGRVERGDGTAVSGARVEVRQSSVEASSGYLWGGPTWGRVVTHSDDEGQFRAEDVLPGQVELRVVDAAGPRAALRRELVPEERARCDVVLGVPAALRGQLVTSNDQPLPAWTLELRDETYEVLSAVTTDAAGRFEFAQCEAGASYVFSARHASAVPPAPASLRRVQVTGEEQAIRLPDSAIATSYASFEVERFDGELMDELTVVLFRTAPHGLTDVMEWSSRASDGRHRVGPMLGGHHELMVHHPDIGQLSFGSIDVRPNHQLDLGRRSCGAPATLTVRTLTAEGAVASRQDLWIGWGDGDGFQRAAEEQAELHLQPGSYWLTSLGPGGVPARARVDLEPGARRELTLQLGAARSYLLRYVGEFSQFSLIRLQWYREGQLLLDYRRPIAQPGQTGAIALPGGNYRVVARDPFGREAVTRLTLDESQATPAIEIRLPSGR